MSARRHGPGVFCKDPGCSLCGPARPRRTGTGVRTVAGQTYCDEPGCPADGQPIDPDVHVHGEPWRKMAEDLASVDDDRLPTDVLREALGDWGQALFEGLAEGLAECLRVTGERMAQRRVQRRVQRDSAEPESSQVTPDEPAG